MDVVEIISNVGFPIACCIVMFKQNSDLSKTIGELSTTLKVIESHIKKED